MKKIYVASSWRNEKQPEVVQVLRDAGHAVYDFKDEDGFHWSEIDEEWESWNMPQYRNYLNHPLAQKGYGRDFKNMKWADTFVGVMPFGRSASMEMGWAAGKKKKTVLLLSDGEPELMVKMFDHICIDFEELLGVLRA